MSDEAKLKEEIYEKLDNEYNAFINELKTKTPEEIIDKSYEKVMKEELKEMFYPDNCNYDIAELKSLKKVNNPLEELYQGWMDFDGGIHEQLDYSVEDTLNFLREQEKIKKNKSMER